jgi:hypothetical protein
MHLAWTADRRAQRLHALPRVARKLVPGNPLRQLVIQHLRRRLCNVIVHTQVRPTSGSDKLS